LSAAIWLSLQLLHGFEANDAADAARADEVQVWVQKKMGAGLHRFSKNNLGHNPRTP
jgi:hypothetical protein